MSHKKGERAVRFFGTHQVSHTFLAAIVCAFLTHSVSSADDGQTHGKPGLGERPAITLHILSGHTTTEGLCLRVRFENVGNEQLCVLPRPESAIVWLEIRDRNGKKVDPHRIRLVTSGWPDSESYVLLRPDDAFETNWTFKIGRETLPRSVTGIDLLDRAKEFLSPDVPVRGLEISASGNFYPLPEDTYDLQLKYENYMDYVADPKRKRPLIPFDEVCDRKRFTDKILSNWVELHFKEEQIVTVHGKNRCGRKGDPDESAGQSRQGVADERAVRERAGDPSRP